MANIAEECGRNRDTELARFLRISMGSAAELESHLRIATDSGLLESMEAAELEVAIARIQRMLASLIRRVASSQ